MTRNINSFVVYMVLGALALGVLPAAAEGAPSEPGAARQNRAGADAPAVRRTPKTAAPPKVNTAPLRAFLVRAKRLKDQGKIDLGEPRSVTVEADRAADGTLSNAKITGPSAADPAFRKLALDFVSSLNESRALGFLDDVSRVRMTFALDSERFRLDSASDAPSEARAGEMARGYRAMINIARLMRRGGDEAVVLNNMKVSASGKQLVMNLDMPRETMGNILLKQITPN